LESLRKRIVLAVEHPRGMEIIGTALGRMMQSTLRG
jgi:hypothetical protein